MTPIMMSSCETILQILGLGIFSDERDVQPRTRIESHDMGPSLPPYQTKLLVRALLSEKKEYSVENADATRF